MISFLTRTAVAPPPLCPHTISLGGAPSSSVVVVVVYKFSEQPPLLSSIDLNPFSTMAPSSTAFLLAALFLLGFCLVDSRSVYDHHHHRSAVAGGRWLVQAAAPAVTIGDLFGLHSTGVPKSWKRKMCNKMCGVCCSRCNCVPPGTSAETRSTCPCYATMTTPRGKLKCP
ncbi:hypothetical protein BHM03_00009479 [Ensete ventricosum]|uniref:Uncharacterized protein n=1 Tax=Ensete ventricosum TaxID=4639 RepID=A0A445MCS3_ENSVE|nr:hypothetical protein BHM03_00009479 [Ensete ventricosum]